MHGLLCRTVHMPVTLNSLMFVQQALYPMSPVEGSVKYTVSSPCLFFFLGGFFCKFMVFVWEAKVSTSKSE